MQQSGRAPLLAVFALVVGTAFADDKYVKSKEPEFPEGQPDHALVYFARPEFMRMLPLSTFKVFVDGTPAGWLPQRSYLAAHVEPGRRMVWGTSRSSGQRFDFVAGRTYLLLLLENYGGPNRALVETSWIAGDPAAIRPLVADKKLSYVSSTEEARSSLRAEAGKDLEKELERERKRESKQGGTPAAASVESPAPSSPATPPAESAAALPEGFVLYEGLKDQFTIALPEGWTAYDQGRLVKGTSGRFGLVSFLESKSSNIDTGTLLSAENAGRIDTGATASFFVQRQPAEKGTSCSGGFPVGAEKKLVELISGDPVFKKAATTTEAPHAAPASVAGCRGLSIRGRSQLANGIAWVTDAHLASDGETLYIFSLRNHADNYEKNVEVFQKAMATARLSAAR